MIAHEISDLKNRRKHSKIIIMLPFAGGNTYAYRDIIKFIPPSIDVICPELPGRGSMFDEVLLKDMEAISDYIFDKWLRRLDISNEYIIFGHSMGALLSFLLVHKIKKNSMKLPKHLIVAGRKGPGFEKEKETIYALPSEPFRKKVKEIGGTLNEVIENEMLMDYFEPILRADFEAVQTYTYVPQKKLDIPISVFYGTNENFSEVAVNCWQEETTHPIKVIQMEGRHFFIFEHGKKIAGYLSEVLVW